MSKRTFKIAAIVVGSLVSLAIMLVLIAALWIRSQVAGSLPQLDGELVAETLSAPVTIERDGLGIPTLRAANRNDLAYATGFVHAQDRYFQMDLLRRNSAGELAEIIGKPVLEADRRIRRNRFRQAAERVLAEATPEHRALLEAYTAGANDGLQSLRVKPFEYLLLGVEPAPWKPADSALVMFSMYLDLQGNNFRDEVRLGTMQALLPPALFEFLTPRGTEWDAPIQGEALAQGPIPGAEVFDTRQPAKVAIRDLKPLASLTYDDGFHPGSNNWAVSGKQTADGRALVADDMHLGIRVPHIWYRASFVWPAPASSATESQPADAKPAQQQMTGVSLPGTPAIVVGSNGHVAWGFTNSEGDWVDAVIVETLADDKESYLTPDGPKKFGHEQEIIKVKGAPDETLDLVTTVWGPIFDHDTQQRPLAIRWVAHDSEGVNMGLLEIESAQTLEEAMRLANLSGSPAQNFVVADDKGRIGWTILGRIPRRVGFDGRLPSSWADGSHRWDGYLTPEEYPRIVEPENGRIWTANARVVSGAMLATLGEADYDLGARASQIRDDLLATEKATEADMLRIQLDDRAMFLDRWQKLLLETLSEEAIANNPQRKELRKFVESWGGAASLDSVGFRAVRAFRLHLMAQLSNVLTTSCKKAREDFSMSGFDRTEGPIWQIVSQQPEHLIDPRFKNWQELLLAATDHVIAESQKDGGQLSGYTWGQYNTSRIQHPLSLAVPALASWLDMPAQALSGDTDNMPRIQGPAVGASQRMAVSPGHESDGYMHMPCGQSGNPLSPHYRDSHAAWAEGKPSPFMPGKTEHTLVLKPAK